MTLRSWRAPSESAIYSSSLCASRLFLSCLSFSLRLICGLVCCNYSMHCMCNNQSEWLCKLNTCRRGMSPINRCTGVRSLPCTGGTVAGPLLSSLWTSAVAATLGNWIHYTLFDHNNNDKLPYLPFVISRHRCLFPFFPTRRKLNVTHASQQQQHSARQRIINFQDFNTLQEAD